MQHSDKKKLKSKGPWPMSLNKVSLQTNFERDSYNFSYISFLGMNFENLTVEFYVLIFLTCISNFVQIGYYLLFDQLIYFFIQL